MSSLITMPPELRRAIIRWQRDLPIPTDLAMKLAELGFDVPALEQRYRA